MSMHVAVVASRLRAVLLLARKLAADLIIVLWGGSLNQYCPGKYYMRGPGPKWREKHAQSNDETKLIKCR